MTSEDSVLSNPIQVEKTYTRLVSIYNHMIVVTDIKYIEGSSIATGLLYYATGLAKGSCGYIEINMKNILYLMHLTKSAVDAEIVALDKYDDDKRESVRITREALASQKKYVEDATKHMKEGDDWNGDE